MEHAAAAAELCARYDFAYYAEWPTILGRGRTAPRTMVRPSGIERAMDQDGPSSGRCCGGPTTCGSWRTCTGRPAARRRLATLAEALAVADANGEHWWTAGDPPTDRGADHDSLRTPTPPRACPRDCPHRGKPRLALRAGISIVRRHPDRRDLLATLLAATPSPNERERSEAAELLAPTDTTT